MNRQDEEQEQQLDPELMELARSGSSSGGSLLRPILMLMVLGLGCYILSDWREELEYYFSPSEPLELGSVTDFPARAEQEPGWSPQLPHNRYVALDGIPIRRSLSQRYQYSKLIGGEVYIEAERDDSELSELERIERGEPQGDRDRSYFEGSGRAVSFAAMPERYATLRSYYSGHYGVTFCVDVDEGTRRQLETQRRELIAKMWEKTYEETSQEEREARGMTPQPSQREVEELMRENPACVDAWLIQAGKAPGDHLWYVILSGLFALFMVVDLVVLTRWVIRAVRSHDG